ncbi:hypothetical protein Srut_57460 [Streptomyces rutgersensis]|nr:hypothetical protein Srut_57460 [Streptomyces rutgersensis]
MSRVRQRTRVDLPEPERPMTTKTSPWRTVEADVADGGGAAGGGAQLDGVEGGERRVGGTRSAFGPKTFQRFCTEKTGASWSARASCPGGRTTGGGGVTHRASPTSISAHFSPDHEDSDHRVDRRHRREDGGVGDADVVQAADLQLRGDHGEFVVLGAHPAGPGGVVDGVRDLAGVLAERLVVDDLGAGGDLALEPPASGSVRAMRRAILMPSTRVWAS